MNLVREPDAGNPPVRFDEREVETEHGMRLLRHRRGNPDPEYVEAYPTAPPLDSTLLPLLTDEAPPGSDRDPMILRIIIWLLCVIETLYLVWLLVPPIVVT